MAKDIEVLRNQYFEAIINLQKEEDIRASLPNSDYNSFFPLINGLIEKLQSSLSELQEEFNNSSDPDYREYVKDELDLIITKINICNDLLEQAKKTEKLEEEPINPINVIFAKTNLEKIYVEKDLKDIPYEYWDSIPRFIERLTSGEKEDNPVQAKKMTGNAKLIQIHELKEFKMRLIYKILDADTVYVMMARMKKDNNSAIDRKETVMRDKNTQEEFKKLQKLIQDPNEKEKLIREHKQIQNQIIEYISLEKGGQHHAI